MDHTLTETGLRMTYLRDPATIEALDQDRVLAELTEGVPGAADFLSRRCFSDYDHLVLAADHLTGRFVGMLCARDGATAVEDFVLLETAFVVPKLRGKRVMKRMLALTILRIAGYRAAPTVLVAPTTSPIWYRSLFQLSNRFTGVFFPEPDAQAIPFHSANLARRIAHEIGPNLRFEAATGTLRGGLASAALRHRRQISSDPKINAMFDETLAPADLMLAVIDFRAQTEADILGHARRMYRGR